MSEQPTVQAMDGSMIGWHTGPPSLCAVVNQLVRIPRFAGATREPWNVLQHSLHVARILEAYGCSPQIQAAGILHDVAEVLTGDVPSPFKPPEWAALEEAWVERASKAFGLDINWDAAWGPVKRADAIALHSEGYLFMPPGIWRPRPGYLPSPHHVSCMSDSDVKRAALAVLEQPPEVEESPKAEEELPQEELPQCPKCHGATRCHTRGDGSWYTRCGGCGWLMNVGEAETNDA